MSVRWSWRIFLAFGITAAILLGVGLTLGVRDILFPQGSSLPAEGEKPSTQTGLSGSKVQIVALGDSLTRGTGDEQGKGYAGWLKEQLSTDLKKDVYVLNNGINGYRGGDLLKDLQTKEDIRKMVKEADVVVLSIGGNDLFNVGSEEINPQQVLSRLPSAEVSLGQVLATINSLNNKAPILYMGLYNPFSDLSIGQESGAVVKQWNDKARGVVAKYPNMIFIQTDDLFSIQGRKYISSDHYHPNSEGYKRIAVRMAQVLE